MFWEVRVLVLAGFLGRLLPLTGLVMPLVAFVVSAVCRFERRVAPVFSLVVWALLLPFLFGVAAVAGLLLP